MALLPAIALAVVASSCAAPPTKSFYTLVNTKQLQRPLGSVPLCKRQLVVESVETAVPYDIDRIVFRNDEFEIKHFTYEFWVSPPRDMFTGLLTTRMERERLFDSVQTPIHAHRDYIGLIVTVDAIELIASNKQLEARLAMTLRLRDTKTDEVLWEHNFDTRQPVQGREFDVEYTVRTLSSIYNAEMSSVVRLLLGFLASYEGCVQPGSQKKELPSEP
jgi:ABC-type uncharacterized transport system auxiliary subunit